jgi:hypothetical protein
MPRKPTLLLMSTHRLEEDYYFEKMKRIPDVFASICIKLSLSLAE